MSSANAKTASDWTHLLQDPELVSHIAKLLQAYRDAAPEKREQALIDAMRKIKAESAARSAEKTSNSTAEKSAPAKPGPAPTTESAPAQAQPPFRPMLLTPSVGEDRRKFPRMKCFIAVEIRNDGNDSPVWGNLANVSAGGCYIETLTPVSNGSNLQIGLWVNNGKVWVKGIVLNGVVVQSNPCFGIRVKFTEMNADERETFRFFLEFVEGTTRNYESQNGYLAQLKR